MLTYVLAQRVTLLCIYVLLKWILVHILFESQIFLIYRNIIVSAILDTICNKSGINVTKIWVTYETNLAQIGDHILKVVRFPIFLLNFVVLVLLQVITHLSLSICTGTCINRSWTLGRQTPYVAFFKKINHFFENRSSCDFCGPISIFAF